MYELYIATVVVSSTLLLSCYHHPANEGEDCVVLPIFQEFPIVNAAYKPGQIMYKKDINVCI